MQPRSTRPKRPRRPTSPPSAMRDRCRAITTRAPKRLSRRRLRAGGRAYDDQPRDGYSQARRGPGRRTMWSLPGDTIYSIAQRHGMSHHRTGRAERHERRDDPSRPAAARARPGIYLGEQIQGAGRHTSPAIAIAAAQSTIATTTARRRRSIRRTAAAAMAATANMPAAGPSPATAGTMKKAGRMPARPASIAPMPTVPPEAEKRYDADKRYDAATPPHADAPYYARSRPGTDRPSYAERPLAKQWADLFRKAV